MKKIISVTLTAVLLLICAVSCGAKRSAKYVGKWEASEIAYDGTSTDNFFGVPVGALFRFEITQDGKVTWKSAVDNKVIQNANSDIDIKWQETADDKIQFTVYDRTGKDDTRTMNLTYRSDMLCIEEDGSSVNLRKVDEFSKIDPEALNSAASVIQNFNITDSK